MKSIEGWWGELPWLRAVDVADIRFVNFPASLPQVT